MNIQQIPLDQLRLSPRNVRKTGGTDIDDLMASIEAEGVLNNLVVTNSTDGLYDVEDGGRRLRALQQLHEAGRLTDAQRDVPCKIVALDNAVEAGLSANIIRMAMHPADEFVAFKRLIDDGNTIAEIATRFGKSHRYIEQRLKLANVHPALFELYRQEEMNLDQLMTLASTDNHELQRQAWESADHEWQRSPDALRKFLLRDSLDADDTLPQFVGLDAYEQAGGRVRNNLFTEDVALLDLPLLDTLALDKLEAIAQQHRDAGWAWAEARISMGYEEKSQFPRIPTGHLDTEEYATPEDAARAGVVETRQAEIEDLDWDVLEVDARDALTDELNALEGELDTIRDRMIDVYPADIMAKSGVLVYVGSDGLRVEPCRLRPNEKLGKDGAVNLESPAPTKPEKPKKPEFSDAVQMALSAHRSDVARYHIGGDPTLALCLLLEQLLLDHWPKSRASNGVSVSLGRPRDATTLADVHKAVRGALANDLKKLDAIPQRDTLGWLLKKTENQRLDILAVLVAANFDGITSLPQGHTTVTAVQQLTGFDMADHWNPTTDDFLSRIHADLVIEAVTEAKGKETAAMLTGLKKAERTATAAKLLAGTGWLPKPLRGADYGKKKTTALVADAPGKAKKPAAKKATKKPAAKKAVKKSAKKVAAKKRAKAGA